MVNKKKIFHIKKGYSTEIMTIRPDELMAELGIKKSKYYEVLGELEIKADKDPDTFYKKQLCYSFFKWY